MSFFGKGWKICLYIADGSVVDTTDHFGGNNDLMGVGITKSDAVFTSGRGIARLSSSCWRSCKRKTPKYFDYLV